MMANEDYEDVIFSDFSDFLSEHEKGKAVVDPNIGWSSDPILSLALLKSLPLNPPLPTPTLSQDGSQIQRYVQAQHCVRLSFDSDCYTVCFATCN